jgi:hypothetical protein
MQAMSIWFCSNQRLGESAFSDRLPRALPITAGLRMSLPNADRAFVDPGKIRDYLLAMAHSVGRFKARFFASLGYAPDQWELLRDDILAVGRSGSVCNQMTTNYGRMFEVDGISECAIWTTGCG